MSDFVKELNFDGDTFNDMKRDMNFVLQRLLGNMQENCSLRKRDMTGTAALQVIPVTGNYPPPVCSRVSIWKRNLERRLKS